MTETLVLKCVHLSQSGHASPAWEGVKNFSKVFAGGGGQKHLFWWGGLYCLGGGGSHNFEITNLIYFRDISKMHLLSSDKMSFSMATWRKCLKHSVIFPVNLF